MLVLSTTDKNKRNRGRIKVRGQTRRLFTRFPWEVWNHLEISASTSDKDLSDKASNTVKSCLEAQELFCIAQDFFYPHKQCFFSDQGEEQEKKKNKSTQ